MKINKLILILLYFFLHSESALSNDKLIKELQYGGKIIFIRHALAPGNSDPDNINLNDCQTQRNLDARGIEQSKKIGYFFKKNNIPIDKVLSSEWCRCKDTAKYAFSSFETFNALNSFYDEKFYKFKDKQIIELKKYIDDWDSNNNLILVTHHIVILEILNIGVSSGELIISNKDFEIIGTIKN